MWNSNLVGSSVFYLLNLSNLGGGERATFQIKSELLWISQGPAGEAEPLLVVWKEEFISGL